MTKIVTKDTFDIIHKTVNKTVDLIRLTFGPSSNKVIISKVLNKMVVDDGVQIARDLEFDDPVENAILNVVRETAIRTNDRVGDGTTGSLIILRAIINEVASKNFRDPRKIEKELKAGFEEAKEQLLKMAQEITTKSELERVARISFDDETISKLIAQAWYELGKDGVLTVDRSGTMETFVDIAEGIKIDRGYISPYMVTNPQRMEGVIEKPYILLTDYRLTEASDILPIMTALAKKNINSLVLICENIEGNALATMIVNKLQGKFNAIAINAPAAGDNRSVFMEDIALMTGGKVFSQSKGDKLEEVKVEDLGRAERFIAKRESSVIIGAKHKKAEVEGAIKALSEAMGTATDERQRNEIKSRIARFSNKVGVIKVGAATEAEEKALRYKVEDAIHATHAAYKGGVVAGAGLGLASLTTTSPILNKALQEPFKQLVDNVGYDGNTKFAKGDAINVVTGKVGPFMTIGVMDSVDVLIAAMESAVSIASLLITSVGMIIEPPQKPKQE